MISDHSTNPAFAQQSSSAINCTGSTNATRPFNEKRARKQYRGLRHRIHRAVKNGDHDEAERLTRVFLESVNCIRVAALEVRQGMKKHERPTLKYLIGLADTVDLWKPCVEPVWVKYIEKEGRNHDHRPIMVFGLENKIRQVHVRNVLKPQARLLPCQYVMNGGRNAAVDALRQHYLDGYQYLVELDIRNCFSALQGEGVYKVLPLPKEVTRNVVMSSSLNLHTSKTVSRHLGEFEDEVPLEEAFQAEDLEAVRWGIPQGSCAAPLSAEMVLRDVIEKLPDLGKIVNYADNFMIACKDVNAAQAMLSALQTALKGHPAGPLTPGFYHVHKPGDAFDFLGYRITPRGNGSLKFDLGPRKRDKLDRRLTAIRSELHKDCLSDWRKAKALRNFARDAISFRAQFPLWRGGDAALQKLFGVLDDMAFAHGLDIELPPIKNSKKEFE